jgi:hypothetical protein
LLVYDGTPRFGLYATSAEVLDRQNIFFGASLGTNKEFDLYAGYEVRRFYPTLYAEIIRLREYADDRVDLPPERWNLRLRYDLWEFEAGLRFEWEDPYSLTHRNELGFAVVHGEYGVHLDVAVSRYGEPPLHDSWAWKYFIGNRALVRYRYRSIERAVDSDANPRGGREIALTLTAADDRLHSGEFQYAFRPVFTRNRYLQANLDWREYLALPFARHTLVLRFFFAGIDRKVDDFFYVYLGGRDFLRGYTYYAIGGRKAWMGSVTYRFPLWRIHRSLGPLFLRDLHGSLFFEGGTAWNTGGVPTRGYYQDLGMELRLRLGSFYAYPTSVSLALARSLDRVRYFDPVYTAAPIIISPTWRSYLSVGFQFE